MSAYSYKTGLKLHDVAGVNSTLLATIRLKGKTNRTKAIMKLNLSRAPLVGEDALQDVDDVAVAGLREGVRGPFYSLGGAGGSLGSGSDKTQV